MDDFNAIKGKEGWINWPNNMRKFSTGMINENGEKLLHFSPLLIKVLWTSYRNIHQSASIYGPFPSGKKHNQVDYIVVPNSLRGSIKHCRVNNSAEIYSDHWQSR